MDADDLTPESVTPEALAAWAESMGPNLCAVECLPSRSGQHCFHSFSDTGGTHSICCWCAKRQHSNPYAAAQYGHGRFA